MEILVPQTSDDSATFVFLHEIEHAQAIRAFAGTALEVVDATRRLVQPVSNKPSVG